METTSKERPILFSGAMVRAILEGRKTQTRRIAKVPDGFVPKKGDDGLWYLVGSFGWDGALEFPCPYGVVGDRLWVRETWAETLDSRGKFLVAYRSDETAYHVLCDCDGEGDPLDHEWTPQKIAVPISDIRWRPSIHMPRWASRLTLEITDVRVHRLQNIVPRDCVAEGIAPTMRNEPPVKDRFRDLWDSINAKRGHGWDKNEGVWAITFKMNDER